MGKGIKEENFDCALYLDRPLRDLERNLRIQSIRNGGNPASHTPAHNVTAAAAPFQA